MTNYVVAPQRWDERDKLVKRIGETPSSCAIGWTVTCVATRMPSRS